MTEAAATPAQATKAAKAEAVHSAPKSRLRHILAALAPTATTTNSGRSRCSVSGPCRRSGMTEREGRKTPSASGQRSRLPRAIEATGCPAFARVAALTVGDGGSLLPSGRVQALPMGAAGASGGVVPALDKGASLLRIALHNFHNHALHHRTAQEEECNPPRPQRKRPSAELS